jgi:hypothetical protein
MSLSAYIQPVWYKKMGSDFAYGNESAIYNAGDTPLTTDWVHPSAPAKPIPYGWRSIWEDIFPEGHEVSVVTGNGFSGNAVRSEGTWGVALDLFQQEEVLSLHEPIWQNTYLMEFSYRSNIPVAAHIAHIGYVGGFDLRFFGPYGSYFPANTGNAAKVRIKHTFDVINTPYGNMHDFIISHIGFYARDINMDGVHKWMEIDGVRLWKLSKSPTIVIQEVVWGASTDLIKGYTNLENVQLQILNSGVWEDYGSSQSGSYYNSVYLSYTQPPKRNEFRVKAWNVVGTYFYSNIYED